VFLSRFEKAKGSDTSKPLGIDGVGSGLCVSEGESVGDGEDVGDGEGVGVCEGVGVREGVGVDFLTTTPLLQTNLFPDLIHVNFLPR
jgi:hypothetical protein